MPEYTVAQGDCIESIAQKHGHFWETLWDHPDNADLKKQRKDPNVLLPGDVVFVPEKRAKDESGGTGERHRFRRKGVPSMLRIVVRVADEPRANQPYTLVIDGEQFTGTTDSEGLVEQAIPPDAKSGKLILGPLGEQDEYELSLGCVDPVTEISGVQGRLDNLGFDCGPADGELNDKTKVALKEFQEKYELPVTGEPDEATRKKLEEVHGC